MEYTRLNETVKIKKISETETEGVFEIEGLYTGFGLTVGNALRRVLLSSIPGAAITQIKIKNVKHEFSTIEGVLEDVVEIVLNLKKARFKFFTDEPQVLILEAKGEKEITASDIKANAQVEVVNPDLHICTLTSKKAELTMELTVEKGLGYVPVEARKAEKLPVGVIAIDAIFTPVSKVNFTIENMRVGEKTDYNRLNFVIETDGTISPSAVLHKGANILRDHFDKISVVEVKEGGVKSVEKKEAKKKKK
ncbi:DNA-directed RNA polymerase subunit alpha [Candidatus Wolfebacteria bacterium CG10_big_fil_rev_8_21_14_0_10_31_9]|uniref:DNA-directed RNA polymerase subunit alpha n=1 Tax=Candidatus Wolfebacteria bacterium CG10_big_fil_rev_8_21_14_0_10_31_9 TaxID=1975070 RepID=A0A2H0RC26_9BACT|nr:MAG: DNA-directed RNA polymerase subunit alpha [Candidatus Wolfebacteria bacterium CG10_big_fil_rev_8_21_14_0_10_31_9]